MPASSGYQSWKRQADLAADSAEHVVKVSAFLADIVPVFMQETEADVQRLAEYAESADLEGIRKIAHVFYGTAGSYGFDEISRFGMEIGETARAEDIARVRELIAGLTVYWRGLKVEFEDDDGDDFMC
jgi:HPt (histidine-containing phosphotransfer) domain-containing protein